MADFQAIAEDLETTISDLDSRVDTTESAVSEHEHQFILVGRDIDAVTVRLDRVVEVVGAVIEDLMACAESPKLDALFSDDE